MASRQPEPPAAAITQDCSQSAPTSEPAPRAPAPAAAAGDISQPSASPSLADLIRRIGWEKSEAARRLFPDANFNTVRAWINGNRIMPAAHEPFVARLAAEVEAFEDSPEELQAQLTPERIEELRRDAAGAGEAP
jgi:hypothetical protein